MGRNACAATPSSLGMGGEAWPSRASASPTTATASSTLSPMAASCCCSRAPAPSQSRMTGRARLVRKPSSSSVTRVDSALSGRNAAESFSCTVDS